MRRNRRGTFFIQTMISMGAASMLMVLAISLIHRSFNFCSDYRKSESNNLQIRNLGHKLRQDLLITQSLAPLANDQYPGGGLELHLFDGSVVSYSLESRSVVRTRSLRSQESVDSRNTFQLAKNWEANFKASPSEAQLTIVRKLPLNDGPQEITLLRVACQPLRIGNAVSSNEASETADNQSFQSGAGKEGERE